MEREYIVTVPSAENERFCMQLAGVTYENPNYFISRPETPTSVVEYVVSGVGHLEVNRRSYTVSAGDMYILPPEMKHSYYSDAEHPWRKIWFNSQGFLLRELLRIYGIEHKIVFRNANGYEYMQKILNLCEDKSLSGEEINRRTSVVLFELVCFLAEHERSCEKDNASEAEILKEYIDRNIEKNIRLDKLAEQIFRSVSQTVRIFKQAYGEAPYEYLLRQKMLRANLFLQNTHLSVKEIALRLGFCDEHYFSNLYKKKTGKTPSAFRKNSR